MSAPAQERTLGALVQEYDGVFTPETVVAAADGVMALWGRGQPVRSTYLTPLLWDFLAQRLADAAAGPPVPVRHRTPVVLVVCGRHPVRAHLAAAVLAGRPGSAVDARAAAPALSVAQQDEVDGALRSRGLPVVRVRTEGLTAEALRDADVLLSLGGGDVTPLLPGLRYLDWPPGGRSGRDLGDLLDDLLEHLGELSPALG